MKRVYRGVALVLLAAVLGCTSDEDSRPDAGADDLGCPEQPTGVCCAGGCEGNAAEPPTCKDGEWSCPEGQVRSVSCPQAVCAGDLPCDTNAVPTCCIGSCFNDIVEDARCESGTWRCPEGTFSAEDCGMGSNRYFCMTPGAPWDSGTPDDAGS